MDMDSIPFTRSSDCTDASHEAENSVFLMHVLILYRCSVRGHGFLFTAVFSSDRRLKCDRIGSEDTSIDHCGCTFVVGGRNRDFDGGILHSVHDFGDGGMYYWTGINDDVGR